MRAFVGIIGVIIEIGVAPTRPAEWVVLRIGLWDGGARVTEG